MDPSCITSTHLEKAGYHSWATLAHQATSLPAWFQANPNFPSGKTRKQRPMEEDGCRDISINTTSCFQAGTQVPLLPLSILQPAHVYQDHKLIASPKSTSRAVVPDTSPFHITGAAGPAWGRANTTNTVSLKPLDRKSVV